MPIGLNFRRIAQPTLYQSYQDYLNQALPDISGIFASTPAQAVEETTEETVAQPAGLTPEQLRLLYPQQNQGGGDNDNRTGFGDFNNLDQTDYRDQVVDGEIVRTYRNVNSGLYQTIDGKNVQNLGLNLPFASFLGGIFGIDTTPQYPGYFQQDPATRGGIIDFLSGKTRRDKLEQFRVDQIEKDSSTGVEDPSDYLARQERKQKQKDYAKIQKEIFQSRHDTGNNDGGGNQGGNKGGGGESEYGGFCFDPDTLIQMADGSEKKIKEIQLGDNTKGGEVTGVFQFKASDEIHNYKGVTVAGSHYVKEDGRFIMVKDSPISVKIDKIPVVYSLDTTGRRIFINDIEFADYNGDGIAKGFLTNAGVDLTGFDKEVLRQVENRLI